MSAASDVQRAIDDFVTQCANGSKDLGPLIKVVQEIKQNGATSYRWGSLKKLLKLQLQNVLDEYKEKGEGKLASVDGESFEVRYSRLKQYMDDFAIPPFTLQRIAELLLEPRRHYRNADTFFFSFTKLVYGIGAAPELQTEEEDGREASKKKAKVDRPSTPSSSSSTPSTPSITSPTFSPAAESSLETSAQWLDLSDLPST